MKAFLERIIAETLPVECRQPRTWQEMQQLVELRRSTRGGYDYTSPVALRVGKGSPRLLAGDMARQLPASTFERIDVSEHGFLNFVVSLDAVSDSLTFVLNRLQALPDTEQRSIVHADCQQRPESASQREDIVHSVRRRLENLLCAASNGRFDSISLQELPPLLENPQDAFTTCISDCQNIRSYLSEPEHGLKRKRLCMLLSDIVESDRIGAQETYELAQTVHAVLNSSAIICPVGGVTCAHLSVLLGSAWLLKHSIVSQVSD